MAIMHVVQPYPAAEYTGSNAAEMVQVANHNGVAHTVASEANGTLTLTGENSSWTIQTGEVIVAAPPWGFVVPRAVFDQMCAVVQLGGS